MDMRIDIDTHEPVVTIPATRYTQLIEADLKLTMLCEMIWKKDSYHASDYRIIVGEELIPLTESELETIKRREQIAKEGK